MWDQVTSCTLWCVFVQDCGTHDPDFWRDSFCRVRINYRCPNQQILGGRHCQTKIGLFHPRTSSKQGRETDVEKVQQFLSRKLVNSETARRPQLSLKLLYIPCLQPTNNGLRLLAPAAFLQRPYYFSIYSYKAVSGKTMHGIMNKISTCMWMDCCSTKSFLENFHNFIRIVFFGHGKPTALALIARLGTFHNSM